MSWVERLPSGRYRALYRDAHDKRRSAGTYKHKAEATRKAGAAMAPLINELPGDRREQVMTTIVMHLGRESRGGES